MTTLREKNRPPAQRLVKARRVNTDADTYFMTNLVSSRDWAADDGVGQSSWPRPS